MGRVSVIQVRALVEAVEREGVRGSELLERAGFDAALWEATDEWISAGEYDRLIELSVELTKNPAFGLHWGERSSLMKYDLITPLVATARNLRCALAAIVRFQRLLSDHPEIAFEEADGGATVRFSLEAESAVARRARAELGMVGMCRILAYYCGGEATPRTVWFDFEPPGYAAEYARLFGEALSFGAPGCALSFDAALLDLPQVQWNARIYEAMEAEAERALAQLGGQKQHTEALRQHLTEAFPELPDMGEAAKRLGMAERSLRRRLAEEGASFHELLVEARVNGARRLLQNPRCSIKEAAYLMGFASPSAFHHAFKRWTGVSPSAARNSRPPRT